eukprot:9792535-Alexandrium_andersonii.AAC.1
MPPAITGAANLEATSGAGFSPRARYVPFSSSGTWAVVLLLASSQVHIGAASGAMGASSLGLGRRAD